MKKKVLLITMITIIILAVAGATVYAVTAINNNVEKATEPPTEAVTEAPTEKPTEVVTAPPVEEPTTPPIIEPTEPEEDKWVAENRVIPNVISEFDSTSVKVLSAEEAQNRFATFYPPSYRQLYYTLDVSVMRLVSPELLIDESWLGEIQQDLDAGIEQDVMTVVVFIKYYKIPKEDFERAVEEQRKGVEGLRDRGYEMTEEYEVYNTDIIYTFDNEIINEYYRRK